MGKQWKQCQLYFGGSKITADGDCRHETKRCLLLGRKVKTNLVCILEKAMAPHSSTLACKIPWTEEPGGLPSMGSRRVGHDWSDLAAAAADSIFKSRDITSPTMVHLVKGMVFPVVMHGCESWTVKKAEHEELMLLNCGVGKESWESLGLQGDPTNPFWRRSALGFLWKEWC